MHFVIIGGGIVGSAIALALGRKKAGRVTVLEKETSLGKHASGRNSGVIHSGINQTPGTLKAKMCVEGSKRLRDYCVRRRVPMEPCGTIVVARKKKEEEVLEKIQKMGNECGVPDLRLMSPQELKAREPEAAGVAALLSPAGAIVDPLALLESVAQDAKEQGVEYRLGAAVRQIEGKELKTNSEDVEADHIINCAGLHTDRMAHQMGVGLEYRVIPFRGEYWGVKGLDIRSMVYPVPDLRFPFLGIHLTKKTDGRVLAGPSATLAFGREAYKKEWVLPELASMLLSPQFLNLAIQPTFLRLAAQNAKTSLSKKAFLRDVQSLAPGVKENQLYPASSGIRAQMVDRHGHLVHDLVVEYRKDSTHILNAVSPGMTCSLVFGEYVAEKILS